MGFSPRHIKPSISTHLPVAKHLLTPKVITDVPEKIKIRKEKQKHYYDRHSHELPKLREGDAIRMRLPNEEWSMWRINGEDGTRSYLVEVNGKHYCRNRKWLRATFEELPEWVETNLNMTDPIELVESSPAEPPPPMIPSSSSVVSGPRTEGRPVRDRHHPVWLKDYECWIKTLTLPCASFFALNLFFIMHSCAGALNALDFLKADLNIVLFLSFFYYHQRCLHL